MRSHAAVLESLAYVLADRVKPKARTIARLRVFLSLPGGNALRILLYSSAGIAASPLVHHPALLKILVARRLYGLKNCNRNRFVWEF
jgi:hypothetical protein